MFYDFIIPTASGTSRGEEKFPFSTTQYGNVIQVKNGVLVKIQKDLIMRK